MTRRAVVTVVAATWAWACAGCGAGPGASPAAVPTETARPSAVAADPTAVDVAGAVLDLVAGLHEPVPEVGDAEGPWRGAGPGVVVLVPGACDVATSSTRGPATRCAPGLLRAGSAAGREYVSLIVFDASGLSGSLRLEGAELELTGLDEEFLQVGGVWRAGTVHVDAEEMAVGLSMGKMLELSEPRGGAAWQLAADELAAGRSNVLRLEEEQLAASRGSDSGGRLAFRIEGPADGGGLFAWAGSGPSGPRLRLFTARAR